MIYSRLLRIYNCKSLKLSKLVFGISNNIDNIGYETFQLVFTSRNICTFMSKLIFQDIHDLFNQISN